MSVVLRRQALSIFKAAVRAASPEEAVTRYLAKRSYSRYEHIWVVGAGKASASMARAAERVLGERIAGGLVNTKYGHLAKLRRIELNECSHPIPDEQGAEGARRIVQIAQNAGPHDLVLALISGGASALLPLPAEPITLSDKQAVTKLLLASGADIHQMNAVRKHISGIKGGQLARFASPAAVEALLLSDVIGDDLGVIGSGPTAPDPSTFADALAVLDRYKIRKRVPVSVRQRLESGARGEIAETPKPSDAVFKRVRNVIVGSNRLAMDAAAKRARELGFRTLVLASEIEGETRDVAHMHAAIARETVLHNNPVRPPACYITGGETTVTLKGSGLGGRNQEFTLAAAIDIAGLEDVVVLSAGTDGTDGPTDAAGAIADGHTLARNPDARRFLDNNDSYHYFESLNDLVKTGPTGTNVMDVRIILVGSGRPHSTRKK
jgi:hydroxypyruvate reductase